MGSSVGASVGSSVGASVASSVGASVGASVAVFAAVLEPDEQAVIVKSIATASRTVRKIRTVFFMAGILLWNLGFISFPPGWNGD